LTKAERKELDTAAQKVGMDTSTWLRVIGLAAIKVPSKKGTVNDG